MSLNYCFVVTLPILYRNNFFKLLVASSKESEAAKEASLHVKKILQFCMI